MASALISIPIHLHESNFTVVYLNLNRYCGEHKDGVSKSSAGCGQPPTPLKMTMTTKMMMLVVVITMVIMMMMTSDGTKNLSNTFIFLVGLFTSTS